MDKDLGIIWMPMPRSDLEERGEIVCPDLDVEHDLETRYGVEVDTDDTHGSVRTLLGDLSEQSETEQRVEALKVLGFMNPADFAEPSRLRDMLWNKDITVINVAHNPPVAYTGLRLTEYRDAQAYVLTLPGRKGFLPITRYSTQHKYDHSDWLVRPEEETTS